MELSRRICAKDTPDREAALNTFMKATEQHLANSFKMLANKWGISGVMDHFNDAYIGFWQYAHKIGERNEHIENLCGAFYVIGRRTLLNVIRKKGLPPQDLDDLTTNRLGELDPMIEQIINPDPDVLACVEWAMQQLSDDDRMIIHLYYYEQLSHKQIAEHLNIIEEVSKNRLSRARKRLRDYLKDCLDDQEN